MGGHPVFKTKAEGSPCRIEAHSTVMESIGTRQPVQESKPR